MKAKIFTALTDPELAAVIISGAVGVIPTDTVYGLVAAERNKDAIEKMYSTKQRERQPGTTIAASTDDLLAIGFPKETLERAAQYWPDPISIEMETTDIPRYISAGQPVMAARIPNKRDLLKLLTKTGPLMTTSANRPGEPTATTIKNAMDYFGDSVDFYVDVGELGERPPSTIIGFSATGQTVVYRQGAFKL